VGRAASVDAAQPDAVAIIGGGPAALSAAVYCARAGLRPVVIAPPVGGQLMGKGVDVENYPGLLDMTGPGIVSLMRQQALSFNTAFDGNYITNVDLSERPFKLTTNTSSVLQAHSVIVATGADSNWLDVPGACTRVLRRWVGASTDSFCSLVSQGSTSSGARASAAAQRATDSSSATALSW